MDATNTPNPFKGLSRTELHDQLSRYILTENQLKKSIKQTIQDYETWKNRLKSARDSGKADLISHAEDELKAFGLKLATLTTELDTLETELKQVKKHIRDADIEQQGRVSGVDPQGLLSVLESMVGKTSSESALDKSLEDTQADDMLAQLKAKLREETNEK